MYTEKDFKECFINPLKKNISEDERVSEMFSILCDMPQCEAIVRFLIAIFDPCSPYVRDITDHVERKRSAAQDFEIEDIDDMVVFSNYEVVQAANWFLRTCIRSMDWAIIQANTETFWEYQLRLMTPVKTTAELRDKDIMSAIQVKSKLAEDLSLISDRIQKHTRIFYGGDEQIVKAASKTKFSSESMASVLKDR